MAEWIEALEKLRQLRDSGAVTNEEFEAQKAKILKQSSSLTEVEVGQVEGEQSDLPSKGTAGTSGGVTGCVVYCIAMVILLPMLLFAFAMLNWNPTEVLFGGGIVLETKLPVIVGLATIMGFALGLVPALFLLSGRRR